MTQFSRATPDDDRRRDEISLDALRERGYEPAAPAADAPGMPEPTDAPTWAALVAHLTPRQVEILEVVFSSSSRAKAAELLDVTPALVRVTLQHVRQRITEVVRWGSSGGPVYAPAPSSRETCAGEVDR